jgi:LPXTG-motif cell wall-anchored protein
VLASIETNLQGAAGADGEGVITISYLGESPTTTSASTTTAGSSSDGSLASTGAETAGTGVLGISLLLVGMLSLVVLRRRHHA